MKAISNRAKDITAFEDLLNEYQPRVFQLAQRMVIDADDAADITQEVFIKVWQKRDQFKGDSAIFTWIYRIATNHCLEFLRKKKKREILRLTDYEEILKQRLESPQYFDGNEYQRILHQAILTLPEKQRIVFQLKYFEELKYEDISQIVDTSVGALKASYHHAVKKIEVYAKDALNQ